MSLGTILKQARNSAGMSIDSLAERTSIRPALLRDFELDDFSKCGGDTYARGHVRNLAHALGVEPTVFLEKFDAEQSTAIRPMHELLAENRVTVPIHQKSRISLKALSLISASAVLLVVGGQIIYTTIQPARGSATNSVIAATSPTPTPSPSTAATGGSLTQPSIAPVVSPTLGVGNVLVLVSATRGPSWLSVSDQNGQLIFAGRLAQGASSTFAGNGVVRIRFGNAGAVDVLVNGITLPTPGAMGQVVDRSYGSNSAN